MWWLVAGGIGLVYVFAWAIVRSAANDDREREAAYLAATREQVLRARSRWAAHQQMRAEFINRLEARDQQQLSDRVAYLPNHHPDIRH